MTTTSPLAADERPRTTVLMRDVGIGDLVWHVPYFRRIARTSAGGQVTLLVPPSTQARDLVGHEPWVRAVVDYDRGPRLTERRRGRHRGLAGLLRLASQMSRLPQDRVVIFTPRSLSAAFACLCAGIPQRVGYGLAPMQRWLLTRRRGWVQPYDGPGVASYWHATELCRRHGWCDGPLVPRLDPRPDALARMREALAALPRPLRAIAIGSSEPFKQWGAERFAGLARLLAGRGDGVLLLGGPAERALAQRIVQALEPALRARVLAWTHGTIAETAAALTLADCCVGNDTGAANLAAAVGTPTWVVLGPRPPLLHDPATLRMIRAPRLEDIAPAHVFEHLAAHAPRAAREAGVTA